MVSLRDDFKIIPEGDTITPLSTPNKNRPGEAFVFP